MIWCDRDGVCVLQSDRNYALGVRHDRDSAYMVVIVMKSRLNAIPKCHLYYVHE